MTSRDAVRERDAAPLDADQRQVVRAAVLLDDLVADADERPAHLVGGHDPARALAQGLLLSSSAHRLAAPDERMLAG